MVRASVIFVFGLPVLVGCSSGSLVGTWTYDGSGKGNVETVVLKLNASGSASSAFTGNDVCSGTLTDLDQTWAATATTLTVTAQTSCSGQIICVEGGDTTTKRCSSGGTSITCTPGSNEPCTSEPARAQTCAYDLSGDSLTLSDCVSMPDSGVSNVGVSQVFTRSGS